MHTLDFSICWTGFKTPMFGYHYMCLKDTGIGEHMFGLGPVYIYWCT